MARPPDRSKTAPVVKLFSSEQSQAIIEAASCTSQEAGAGDLGQHVADVLFAQLVEDAGARRSGGDAVDRDVFAACSFPSDLVRAMTPALEAE